MQEVLEKVAEEIKRPKSRRRKKVVRLITPELISDIESEIIKIDYYLTGKCIQLRGKGYRPNDADEDQPKRLRLEYLRELRLRLMQLS
jgi:hypothetical protein